MQQFWYSIKKIHDTDSYEFLLANKKCIVNAKVFRTILDICLRMEGVDFTDVPDDDIALTFLIDLDYKGPLNRHTNMFMDHMHQSWRSLAAIINKCLFGKTIIDTPVKEVDVSEEFELEPEPTKKKAASKRRVKKKVTIFAKDNIISDPDVALELGKSIILTEAEEAEAARKVHATHARIMTESVLVSAKKKFGDKNSQSVTIQDTPSAPKSKPDSLKSKLKDKDKDITKEKVILEWGDEDESQYSDDDNDDAKKDEKDGDADDEGDDHVIDKQDADDEDDKTKSDEDEIYKYKIRVRKDEDVEMTDAEAEESDKGGKEVTDAAKEDAEMTLEVKDDTKKTELPLSSSSLSVSAGFSDQFLKLSSDSSLVSTVKDSADADVSSLMDIPIQQETPQTQSPSVQMVLVSVLPETTNLPPIPETLTKTPVSTKVPSPQIKKEQAEKQKKPQFTIKSTDKVDLKEYDLKSALYQSMHANKYFNKNPANHQLYHALMEALIEDENAMEKGVADTVKDHKRKHDDDDDDDDKGPLSGPNQGKAPTKGSKTGKTAYVEEPAKEPISENPKQERLNLEWFKQPPRPPTPDLKWNKHQIINLTQDILLGPAFNLLKGTCSSSIELEYNFQECFNALTDKLDWNNLEGDRYPFDLSKPLPLQGPQVTYITSIIKTKAARYEIKGIKDMVPTLWSTIKHAYDKDVKKGIKHWGDRRKLWYRSQVRKFSKHNVYSTKAILGVKSVSVKKLHGYGHLEEIMVKRSDQQLYKFKEGDFVDLHLNDIKDMLLLIVRHKLFHLDGSDIVDFIVALRMFARSLILKRRVGDLQLGVKSY
ncbi:hypothetical protein Tco_1076703 [Tanacetum coccineum]